MSKIVDYDDWTVKDCYFYAVTSVWGPCSLDCFASYKKLARFPGSIPSTLIQIPWVSIHSPLVGSAKHVVPPVSLVKKVILHVCLCRGRGILVVPYWPSALYWPLLVERGGVFKSFVADCLYVENGKDVFLHGGNKSSLFGKTGLYGNLYRLLWSCTPLVCWAAGPIYDERTSFCQYMNIVRLYATGFCL